MSQISPKRSLRGKSVLVTGGAGFVGSHLVDCLIKEGPREIIVATNFFLGTPENLTDAQKSCSNIKIIRCDVSDYDEIGEVFDQYQIDVVFNMAVIPLPTSLVRPEWTVKKNIDMTLNICRLQRLRKFKTLIQYSSSEAYGTAKTVPMHEDHILDPETPYAASKAATDHIALSYYHTFGCDVSVIRPFNQYGPRQNAKKYAGIIPLTIGRIMRGEDLIIFGDGEQTRDFLFVEDTADATIEVYNNLNTCGKILNIASGKEISMNTLVKTIASEMGYKKPIVYSAARQGDVRQHLAGVKKSEEIINWKPKVSFEEGIKRTISWYKQNPNRFI